MIVQFSTTPIICYCTTWGNKINKILHFILFCLFGFSQVVQKQTFGEVGTKMVIWWQVVSEMFAPEIIKICQSFFKSQSIMLMEMLSGIFSFISTHSSLVLFSPGSAETDIGWGRISDDQLCQKYFVPKITKNKYPFFKWQSIMFGVFFSGHGVEIPLAGKPISIVAGQCYFDHSWRTSWSTHCPG